MKYIILIILFLTFSTKVKSQYNESIGIVSTSYYKSTNIEDYDIIHTDDLGIVVWRVPSYFSDEIFDLNNESYNILGYTEVKNNKILSNPSDYDYWLVKKDEPVISVISPNPAINNVNIFINQLVENLQISVYTTSNLLVYNTQIIDYHTNLNLSKLSNGMYFVRLHTDEKLYKIYKLCILQNNYY
jgi:hypothetical protein